MFQSILEWHNETISMERWIFIWYIIAALDVGMMFGEWRARK